jgi:acyl carrier protein phosphodiesterase
MNLLAHALLAAPDAELMFGSLIGDFVRGRIDPGLPPAVRAGVALHRAIDVYTDGHAEVSSARALFVPPLRRYAGILIDVWFDHLLARDWSAYGDGALEDFSRRVREVIDASSKLVPERMRGFVTYLRAHDLPAAYRDTAMIGDVLRGMSQRLSRENPLAEALPVLVALDVPLARHFRAFFPELQSFAAAERDRLGSVHR